MRDPLKAFIRDENETSDCQSPVVLPFSRLIEMHNQLAIQRNFSVSEVKKSLIIFNLRRYVAYVEVRAEL
jgi:hypothetical protein